MYHSMKIKTLERIFTSTKITLKDEKENLQETPIASLQKLINAVKEVRAFFMFLHFSLY